MVQNNHTLDLTCLVPAIHLAPAHHQVYEDRFAIVDDRLITGYFETAFQYWSLRSFNMYDLTDLKIHNQECSMDWVPLFHHTTGTPICPFAVTESPNTPDQIQ